MALNEMRPGFMAGVGPGFYDLHAVAVDGALVEDRGNLLAELTEDLPRGPHARKHKRRPNTFWMMMIGQALFNTRRQQWAAAKSYLWRPMSEPIPIGDRSAAPQPTRPLTHCLPAGAVPAPG
jgi:hypothetical protein